MDSGNTNYRCSLNGRRMFPLLSIIFAKLPVVAMSLPQAVTHQAGKPPLGEYILPRVFDVVKELDYIALSIAQVVVDAARTRADFDLTIPTQLRGTGLPLFVNL